MIVIEKKKKKKVDATYSYHGKTTTYKEFDML